MRKPRHPLLAASIALAPFAAFLWTVPIWTDLPEAGDETTITAAAAVTITAAVLAVSHCLDRRAAARLTRPLGDIEREANHEMQTKLLDTLAKVLDTGPMPRAAAGRRDATRRLRGVDSGDRESPRPGA